jgi:hypothetical protein
MSGIWSAAFGTLAGLGASTAFLLALIIGFCVLFNFPKLKPRGKRALVVRDLGERLGADPEYLAPDAPHGPADQLHTPELLEARQRKPA